MPRYKEMIYSFLSFLGLKDSLNLTRMNWTILSWSYLITWFGNTRIPLKKQEGPTTALPGFLRYSCMRSQFHSRPHASGHEMFSVLFDSHVHVWQSAWKDLACPLGACLVEKSRKLLLSPLFPIGLYVTWAWAYPLASTSPSVLLGNEGSHRKNLNLY